MKAVTKLKYTVYRFFLLPSQLLKGTRIDVGCHISLSTVLNHCTIGKYSCIGPNCILNNVILGNYCSIAPQVQIGGMEHAWRKLSTSVFLEDDHIHGRTTIVGDDVWIGAGAVVRQGVTIGRGAVIGAGAVVLQDVPDYSVWVGVPAKFSTTRFSQDTIDLLEKSEYWKHPPQAARNILEAISKPSQ